MNIASYLSKLLSGRRTFSALSIIVVCTLSVSAQVYRLEGKVGNSYPIVMELTRHDNGYVTGKYAYKSTLNQYGDNPCSWLEIFPDHENAQTTWRVSDCNFEPQETWTNVNFNGTTLRARMRNARGNVYDIEATVVSSREAPDDLAEHFRSHLGEYPSDIAMFSDPDIQYRLESLMGEPSFNYMAGIFQTQFPIEYRGGMFWSGGFRTHQCCDPAAIWAYDTYNKSFYIWVRKDGREYWWSESGNAPLKFQELVNATY